MLHSPYSRTRSKYPFVLSTFALAVSILHSKEESITPKFNLFCIFLPYHGISDPSLVFIGSVDLYTRGRRARIDYMCILGFCEWYVCENIHAV